MSVHRLNVLPVAATTEQIAQAALHHHAMRKSWRFTVPNCTNLFGWEADLVGITRSNFVHEIEIKVDRRDLQREYAAVQAAAETSHGRLDTKTAKHKVLNGTADRQCDGPNYFWIAVPAGLDYEGLIPDYAGVIVLHPGAAHPRAVEMRDAPRLHRGKLTGEHYARMATSLSFRYWRGRQ